MSVLLVVFTSESVGGQMSTEGETGAAVRGWRESRAQPGLSWVRDRQYYYCVLVTTSNSNY